MAGFFFFYRSVPPSVIYSYTPRSSTNPTSRCLPIVNIINVFSPVNPHDWLVLPASWMLLIPDTVPLFFSRILWTAADKNPSTSPSPASLLHSHICTREWQPHKIREPLIRGEALVLPSIMPVHVMCNCALQWGRYMRLYSTRIITRIHAEADGSCHGDNVIALIGIRRGNGGIIAYCFESHPSDALTQPRSPGQASCANPCLTCKRNNRRPHSHRLPSQRCRRASQLRCTGWHAAKRDLKDAHRSCLRRSASFERELKKKKKWILTQSPAAGIWGKICTHPAQRRGDVS